MLGTTLTSPHYWTEKLSDAYLGWSHPLYVGCPNLGGYFPAGGFTSLDPADPDGAVALIRAKLRHRSEAAETAQIAECRDLVLGPYNPFARFAHWAELYHLSGIKAATVCITTHKASRPFPRGWLYRPKSRV